MSSDESSRHEASRCLENHDHGDVDDGPGAIRYRLDYPRGTRVSIRGVMYPHVAIVMYNPHYRGADGRHWVGVLVNESARLHVEIEDLCLALDHK